MKDLVPFLIIFSYIGLVGYIIFNYTIKISQVGSIAIGLSIIPITALVSMFWAILTFKPSEKK